MVVHFIRRTVRWSLSAQSLVNYNTEAEYSLERKFDKGKIKYMERKVNVNLLMNHALLSLNS